MAFKPRQSGNKNGSRKGSTTRPQLRDFYTKKELEEFIASVKERSKTDPTLAKFVGEQIFGKAPQPIEGRMEHELIFDAETRAKANKAIKELFN
jgi:hypothetical protein